MKKALMKVLLAVYAITMLLCTPFTVHAAKTVKMPAIEIVQDYSKAQQILKLINKERKKKHLKALKLDKSLTKHAITRSAELFVKVTFTGPHMRPNGKQNSGKNIIYENCHETDMILDAADVVEEWMNSESHKRGILNPDAKSIGIAAVYTYGQYDRTREVCVAEFGSNKAKSVVKTKKNKKFSIKVSALKKYRKKKYFEISYSYKDYNTRSDYSNYRMGRAVVRYRSPYSKFDTILDGKAFTWKSSNPSIAKITKNGTVTWSGNGTVTFTAVMKGNKKFKFTMTYTRNASGPYI